MGGAVSGVGSSQPSGGKSSPVAQNSYGSPFQGQQPQASSMPSSGGKSAPISQNKYGDSFQAPTGSQAISPMPLMGGMGAGKSSGLGQGGYGAVPGFGGDGAGSRYTMGSDFGLGLGGYGQDNSPENAEYQRATNAAARQGKYGTPPSQQPQPFIGGETVGSTSGGMQPPVGSPYLQQWNQQQARRQALDMPMGNPFPDMPAPGTRMRSFNPYGGYGFQQPQETQPTYIQSPYGNPGQQGISGLQGLYNAMMGQYQQPMQQMPRYGMQGGMQGYRPNMGQVQQNLSRVKPSVQRQQQDAQAARIKELEEQLAQYNTPAPSTNDYSGGG